jgi:hypothetical protein
MTTDINRFYKKKNGGGKRNRTADLLIANDAGDLKLANLKVYPRFLARPNYQNPVREIFSDDGC